MLEKEQYRFAVFMNMTRDERVEHFGYYTQGDFARDHGLKHEKILSEWKRNPKFKKMQQDMFMESFKNILPEARNRLAQRGVEDGDVNALKEIFKITGLSIDRVEQVSNDDIKEVITAIAEIAKSVLGDYPSLYNKFVTQLEEKLGDL